ncbi:MAG TPA: lipid-A-disaccharide synthase [Terriglobales bacterium]|nr:lipid-A-disaccharide synthase [Terriglobales bacterium]
MPLKFLISSGEASGEFYGAQLIEALRRRMPGAEFFGVGGDKMRAAGCDTVVDAHEIAVVGLAEVVRHLPRIYGEFQKLLRVVDARQPDAAILIDFPDFNLRLAKQLHQRGIPVIYYVSPQLWAWRSGRVKQVRKHVRKMLVIFPFEEAFYRSQEVEVEYVGHPLAEMSTPEISRADFAKAHGLDPSKTWIALLPGSRKKEVELNLRAMLGAAKRLTLPHLGAASPRVRPLPGDSLATLETAVAAEAAISREIGKRDLLEVLDSAAAAGSYQFLLPVASSLSSQWLEAEVSRYGLNVVLTPDARATLVHSRAAVVASGTATLEAALIGTPFVMVYRVAALTWILGKPLVRVKHYAMPNLIAAQQIVPELVQADFTAENVAAKLREIIAEGPIRDKMLAGLAQVRRILACEPGTAGTAAERAAAAVLGTIGSERRDRPEPRQKSVSY